MRHVFTGEVLDTHIIDWSQILDLVFRFEVHGNARIEPRHESQVGLVLRAVLTVHDAGICLSTTIRFKLEGGMVAAFGCEKEEAGFEHVDARAWGHCVKELDLHGMDVLLGKVQRELVQIPILALQHEEECLIVEDRA